MLFSSNFQQICKHLKKWKHHDLAPGNVTLLILKIGIYERYIDVQNFEKKMSYVNNDKNIS